MRIMCSIAMLVALKDDIYWPKFQRYTAETACMYLESITLVLVTIARVGGEKKALRQRWSRDCI